MPLQLSFLALIALAPSRAQDVRTPRVLDGAMHHLGDDPTPEWSEAPAEPEGAGLSFTFQARALTGEATLRVRQRHVDNPWHIEINGTRVATLERGAELAEHWYVVPAGVLRDGENTFALVGEVASDDITFGEVHLYEGSFREVFDLRRVTVRVRDAATGGPSPARVTVTDAQGELARLYYAERLHTAVRQGVCYTSDGEARFELAPGDYEVYATRGSEWSLGRAKLSVDAPRHELELELVREVDTRGFVACDTHVHTLTFSGHGDSSVEERMVTLAGEGVELAIATDHNHNTDYRPYQLRMGLGAWFTPVVGNEVTTPVGHFNGFPLDPDDEVPPYELHDVAEVVAGMRAKGAQVVILNHPRWPEHDTGPFGTAALDPRTGASGMVHPYDAMELINSQTEEPRPLSLFEDWFALLNRGERVLAVASSDSHTVGGVVGMGRTWVRSSTDDPAAIDVDEACRNLVAGRSSIGMGPFVDVALGQGRGPGELVPVDSERRVPLALRVRSASWIRPERATVYVDGAAVAELEVPSVPGAPTDALLETVLVAPPHDAWVVCVVTGPGVGGSFWPQLNDYTLAATNPVWLDVDGDGAYSSPRATATRLAARVTAEPALLGTLLEQCDAAVAVHLIDQVREAWRAELDARLRAAAAAAAERSAALGEYLDALSDS